MSRLLLTVFVWCLITFKTIAQNANPVSTPSLRVKISQIDQVKFKTGILTDIGSDPLKGPGAVKNLILPRDIIKIEIIILLAIACLFFFNYHNKKKWNTCFQSLRAKINEQNRTLVNLVSEKEAYLSTKDALLLESKLLLTEKDWLLKELQHRVKNNFHMIISLLNSQMLCTEDQTALDAIKISLSRVQAIALIHQKLSNCSNRDSVNIKPYVTELVNHLIDGLGKPRKEIAFKQFIDPIQIPIAQVVPIGLILTEGITNAIKHAFDDLDGEIVLVLKPIEEELLLLQITDNGKGFEKDLDLQNIKSHGLGIIKGLSAQLKGSLEIKHKQGVDISVRFRLKN